MFTIGIDLGTTTCSVYYFNNNKPTLIPNAEFGKSTQSIIGIKENGEILVGEPALNEQAKNPKGTVYMFKRLIGKKYKEILPLVTKSNYKIVEHTNGDAWVELHGKKYSPIELSSILLKKLVSDAERFLQGKVTKAVITVPAHFNDSQRQATKDAGQLAGLEILRIINEPTAACLAYDIVKNDNKRVVVYDLGGGTFDVSILDISDGVVEVLSTHGDTTFGGEDISINLGEYILQDFKNKTGFDLSNDIVAKYKVKEQVEKANVALNSASEYRVNIPYFHYDEVKKEPIHLETIVTKNMFIDFCKPILTKTLNLCKEAMEKEGIEQKSITDLILVGGPTKNPYIQEEVSKFFKLKNHTDVDPVAAVGMGAAVQVGVLAGDVKDLMLLDVLPISIGVDTAGGIFIPIIEGNTTIPCSKSQVFSTYEDNQESVDIMIYQGERKMSAQNNLLGKLRLDGIKPAQKGIPQIEVTFKADSNGMIDVYAEDLGNKKKVNTQIAPSSGLTKEEIERIKQEAKDKEEVDSKLVEKKGLQLKVTEMLYQAHKEGITELKEELKDDSIYKKYFLSDDRSEETLDTDILLMKKFVEECEEKLKRYVEMKNSAPQDTNVQEVPLEAETDKEEDK